MSGYDENGPCPTADFVYPDEPEPEDRGAAQAALVTFLAGFGGLTVKQAGQRILLLAHKTGQSGCKTDVELARRMRISASRLSHLTRELLPDLTSLSRLNRRQKERRDRNVEP